MRLVGERAEGHRPGTKALHDLRRGLDLVDRHRGTRPEVEKAAESAAPRGLFVDESGVLLEHAIVGGAHSVLQQSDYVGGELMALAVAPPLVVSAPVEVVGGRRRALEAEQALPLHLFELDTADPGHGASEALLHERRPEAHRLEDLRADVALQGGDSPSCSALSERLFRVPRCSASERPRRPGPRAGPLPPARAGSRRRARD